MRYVSDQERPLLPAELYLLLVLALGEGHAYNLRGRMTSLSRGALSMPSGTFTPLLRRMHELGYVDLVGNKPAGKSGTVRRHYGISGHGLIRLKEELYRLRLAVKTAESIGLLHDETPLDIQKLLLEAADN